MAPKRKCGEEPSAAQAAGGSKRRRKRWGAARPSADRFEHGPGAESGRSRHRRRGLAVAFPREAHLRREPQIDRARNRTHAPAHARDATSENRQRDGVIVDGDARLLARPLALVVVGGGEQIVAGKALLETPGDGAQHLLLPWACGAELRIECPEISDVGRFVRKAELDGDEPVSGMKRRDDPFTGRDHAAEKPFPRATVEHRARDPAVREPCPLPVERGVECRQCLFPAQHGKRKRARKGFELLPALAAIAPRRAGEGGLVSLRRAERGKVDEERGLGGALRSSLERERRVKPAVRTHFAQKQHVAPAAGKQLGGALEFVRRESGARGICILGERMAESDRDARAHQALRAQGKQRGDPSVASEHHDDGLGAERGSGLRRVAHEVEPLERTNAAMGAGLVPERGELRNG